MKSGTLASRTAQEIVLISELLGISLNDIPKSRDVKHKHLFQLEKIRKTLQAGKTSDETEVQVLEKIGQIEGIGSATMKKIREGLAESA